MSVETSPGIRRPSLFLYNMEDEESNGRERKEKIVQFFWVFCLKWVLFLLFFWFLKNKQKKGNKGPNNLC